MDTAKDEPSATVVTAVKKPTTERIREQDTVIPGGKGEDDVGKMPIAKTEKMANMLGYDEHYWVKDLPSIESCDNESVVLSLACPTVLWSTLPLKIRCVDVFALVDCVPVVSAYRGGVLLDKWLSDGNVQHDTYPLIDDCPADEPRAKFYDANGRCVIMLRYGSSRPLQDVVKTIVCAAPLNTRIAIPPLATRDGVSFEAAAREIFNSIVAMAQDPNLSLFLSRIRGIVFACPPDTFGARFLQHMANLMRLETYKSVVTQCEHTTCYDGCLATTSAMLSCGHCFCDMHACLACKNNSHASCPTYGSRRGVYYECYSVIDASKHRCCDKCVETTAKERSIFLPCGHADVLCAECHATRLAQMADAHAETISERHVPVCPVCNGAIQAYVPHPKNDAVNS